MNKETSSRVSSLAAEVLSYERSKEITVGADTYNVLLEQAKTLAASCMSQDETPGQEKEPNDFLTRLKREREDLNTKLEGLSIFLTNAGHVSPTQKELLEAQRIHMGEYLAVLDARLADLGISERSTETENSNG